MVSVALTPPCGARYAYNQSTIIIVTSSFGQILRGAASHLGKENPPARARRGREASELKRELSGAFACRRVNNEPAGIDGHGIAHILRSSLRTGSQLRGA